MTIGSQAGVRRKTSRRAYERHAVEIAGECVLAQGTASRCTILNVCAGGMYVHIANPEAVDRLVPGGLLTIRCRVPRRSGDGETLAFIARVVRIEDRHCGLALSEPASPPILRLLEAVVPATPSCPPSRGTPPIPDGRDAILDHCRRTTLDRVPAMLTEFNRTVRDELFRHAEACHNTAEQNAYFIAIAAFNDRCHAFNDAFIERLTAALSRDPLSTEDEVEIPEDGDQLSLMEDEVVEDWLATTDIISHAERINQGELRALEIRLSALYGGTIDQDNNPFRPLVFAETFLECLNELELETAANHCCHHVFREALARTCKGLYPELNGYLVERGIVPKLPAAKKARHDRPARTRASTDADEAGPDRRASQDWGDDPVRTVAPNDATDDCAVADHSPRGIADTGTPDAVRSSGQPVRDIYSIVDELESLRRDLQHQAMALAGTGNRNGSASPTRAALARHDGRRESLPTRNAVIPERDEAPTTPRQGCSPNDLIRALDNLQRSPLMDELDDPVEILPQVDALVRAQFGEEKRIDGRLRNIIDVGGRLFSSLLQDRLVSPQVKGWIKRLEIPLLKHALHDASIFTDRDHVGRQIVNRIAQLEVYGDQSETGHGDSSIVRQINRLLDSLEQPDEIDPALLEKTLRRLELLITIQNEAYAANLGEVVSRCHEEQRQRDLGAIDEAALEHIAPDPSEPEPMASMDEEEGRHWIEKVHNLRPDTWFMFIGHGEQARRLKLAWISKHHDRYVMVNIRGLRELTLTDGQLARRLRDGSALILENAEEPALDRAQYTILQQLHKQLLHETTHDPVTNLLNRHEFTNRLENALDQLRLTGTPFIFAYLDLDQFRIINEACGSQEGDRLLYEFARQLERHLGEEATTARIESDDFAILTPGQSADDLKERLEALHPEDFVHEGKRYPVGFSAAIVPLDVVGDDEQAGTLMNRGQALCRSGRADGGAIVVQREEIESGASSGPGLDCLMRINGILNGQTPLALRFQPIVPIGEEETMTPHHSEVLLAVQDEQGRYISPQQFVIAAEHFRKMPDVDRLVVRQVMQWLRDHPDLVAQTGSLAINLSGRSVNDASFRDFLLEELRNSDIPPELICFEVTETAGLDSLSEAADFIGRVRDLGHGFALDDFGSGMSSYGYLRRLPVDFLKIDGIFIRNLDESPEDYAIVRSITEIGHFMGKQVIAEYVENEAILERLREIGVDFAQGYHVGRPRLLSELEPVRLHRVGNRPAS